MPGRRTGGFVRQRQRTASDWGRLVDPHTAVGAATKVLLASFVLSNPGIGETVRRTHVMLSVVSDQTGVLEQQNGALGMMIVSDLAIAAGAASIPGPVTDASDDGWFLWFGVSQVSIAALGGVVNTNPQSYVIDSKAMRKVADGFSIAVMYESLSQGAFVGTAISLLSTRT